jgi:plasmid stability protein
MTRVPNTKVYDTPRTRLEASAAHRRSPEDDLRESSHVAVARQENLPRENLVTLARRLFGSDHGSDLDIPPRGSAAERCPPDFTGSDDDRPEQS